MLSIIVLEAQILQGFISAPAIICYQTNIITRIKKKGEEESCSIKFCFRIYRSIPFSYTWENKRWMQFNL